uniref:Uncharacterized protein n=1 Tax=Rhinolophus ferrumequinum TaxID=59479 RepID=A0A671DJH8_RHIFE
YLGDTRMPGCLQIFPVPGGLTENFLEMWSLVLCLRGTFRKNSEGGFQVKGPLPPHQSRVNGWLKHLHPFQLVAWTMFLIMVLFTFCFFIPMLPREWQYITYAVSFYDGSTCLWSRPAVSVDPAEASIRVKVKGPPRPSFDCSYQAHNNTENHTAAYVTPWSVETKHCCSCNKRVSGFDHHSCVSHKWFFSSVASACAGLLGIIAIVTCTVVQHWGSPERLCVDPHYGAIGSQGTWLLFLPFVLLRMKTPVVLSIKVSVLLLAIISLVVLGHLLIFHIHLQAPPPRLHPTGLCQQPPPSPKDKPAPRENLGKFHPKAGRKHKRWKSCRLTRSERNGIYEAGPGHHGKRTGRLRKHQPEILPMKTLSSVTACPLGRRAAGGPVAFSCALGVVGGTWHGPSSPWIGEA